MKRFKGQANRHYTFQQERRGEVTIYSHDYTHGFASQAKDAIHTTNNTWNASRMCARLNSDAYFASLEASRIATPCPSCGREEEGAWERPCPSDDCPSHHEEARA